jgi:hypothetical protein
MKTNDEILANPRQFMETYRRAREAFLKIEGVEGVGYGETQTGGEFRADIAFTVYVRRKKPEEELAPEERIPKDFEGYRTDVRVIDKPAPHACTPIDTEFDTIQGGIQIMPKMSATGVIKGGTLACIVRRRNDSGRDNAYLLSNKHVLFRSWAGVDEVIYHPFAPPASGFQSPGASRALGPVQNASFYGEVPAQVEDPTTPNTMLVDDFFVDCAIARIDIDSVCCGSTCTEDKIKTAETIFELGIGNNTITGVRSLFGDPSAIGTLVYKVGRTTRRTPGRVADPAATTAIFQDFNNETPNAPTITVHNVLAIRYDATTPAGPKNCAGHGWFSEEGDSGALIVDEQGRAVGLVSVGPNGNDPDGSLDYACHIVPVLDSLNVCIPTSAGTSHGSSKATDGSGIQPFPGPRDDGLFPPGQIVFTAETAEPVTDDEQRHMRALLEQLRATQRGRELHELFGRYRREIGYLIRNHKLVKAAWHRYKGPAFLAHVLHHLKGHADTVPREVDGVSAISLIEQMADLLMKYGSNPLREVIAAHYEEGMRLLHTADFRSVHDCMAWLQREESAA